MTNSKNQITIGQLAEELFLAPKSLRKKLRDMKIEKPGTHWVWDEDHPTVETIRNFKSTKPESIAAKAEPAKPVTRTEMVGAWTVTIDPENGVKAEAGKDKTKWMTQLSDIRPSLPKAVKAHVEGLLK